MILSYAYVCTQAYVVICVQTHVFDMFTFRGLYTISSRPAVTPDLHQLRNGCVTYAMHFCCIFSKFHRMHL